MSDPTNGIGPIGTGCLAPEAPIITTQPEGEDNDLESPEKTPDLQSLWQQQSQLQRLRPTAPPPDSIQPPTINQSPVGSGA